MSHKGSLKSEKVPQERSIRRRARNLFIQVPSFSKGGMSIRKKIKKVIYLETDASRSPPTSGSGESTSNTLNLGV
jgi:hypothetical protein